jgi:hypothetical protein
MINSNAVTDVLTEREAAQLICFSYRTLQAWRQRCQGPPFIKVSRRSIRYSRTALIAWMDAQTCSPGLADPCCNCDASNVPRETAYLRSHTMANDPEERRSLSVKHAKKQSA